MNVIVMPYWMTTIILNFSISQAAWANLLKMTTLKYIFTGLNYQTIYPVLKIKQFVLK